MSYESEVLLDQPVAYWRLGEPSGTNANDEITTNDGTYTGGFTLAQASGLINDTDTAVLLNGTTGFISVEDNAVLDLADLFTLEAWVKHPNAYNATWDGIVSKQVNSFSLNLDTTGKLNLVKNSVDIIVTSTIQVPQDSTFHHVVATKSGATVKLYIDSVDVTGAVGNQTCVNNASQLFIGKGSAGGDFFDGTIDEVAIYNYALSATRISKHYTEATVLADTAFQSDAFQNDAFQQVVGSVTVTPGIATLTLATFAPTATASDHKLVTPGLATLTTATFAPTVTASDHQIVTPGVASLVTATFAPTISVSDNKSVTPDIATLTTATFAPTVTVAVAGVTVTPDTATLMLATFAPTVLTPVLVTPATATLTLSTFAPAVTTPVTVTPGTASLVTSTFAPTVTTPSLVVPATAALSLSTFAPTVTATVHVTVTPDPAALVLSAFAPTVATSNPVSPEVYPWVINPLNM